MKKKYIIVLVGQSLVILLMLIYAIIQKATAEKQREMAERERRNAEEIQTKMLEIEIKYQELLKENDR